MNVVLRGTTLVLAVSCIAYTASAAPPEESTERLRDDTHGALTQNASYEASPTTRPVGNEDNVVGLRQRLAPCTASAGAFPASRFAGSEACLVGCKRSIDALKLLYQRRQCIAGCTLVAVRDIARLVPCGLLGNSARSLNADTLNDGGQYLWCS